MASKTFLFSSESVSEGHPDKVADQISDGVLDACLSVDTASRVACETMVKSSVVILAGEITCAKKINYDEIVRNIVQEIGYTRPELGFDYKNCEIVSHITEQSSDISMGVNEHEGKFKEQGAGDQGIMFGYACNETPEYLPLPICLANRLVKQLAASRKAHDVDFLRPDAKSQVSVEYVNGKPMRVDTVVVSTQHSEHVSSEKLEDYVINKIVRKVIPSEMLTDKTRYLINPTGRFVIGGPLGDCGLTGRKIIVDTYGGYSRHGGGAFSGKDPSKVDRSAAYAARHIAKNVVGSGLAEHCEVQLAYAIGVAEPVSIYVDTFGTGRVSDEKIAAAIAKVFKLTPKGIIEGLNLLRPIYRQTAAYGHFGREATAAGHFSWEKLDKVDALRTAAS